MAAAAETRNSKSKVVARHTAGEYSAFQAHSKYISLSSHTVRLRHCRKTLQPLVVVQEHSQTKVMSFQKQYGTMKRPAKHRKAPVAVGRCYTVIFTAQLVTRKLNDRERQITVDLYFREFYLEFVESH